ncbi:zinc finger protein 681-like [Octopus sinensis]|uniref:Zinc finger protein 681-like n=1 Tax=Octopus sinensis TaxID=2607531 RepID=A0A7E6FIU4_9MOLL|nr:zinc finger protein 681-like [Octopus sinensis]
MIAISIAEYLVSYADKNGFYLRSIFNIHHHLKTKNGCLREQIHPCLYQSQRHSLAAHICIHTGKNPFDSDIHGKLFNETSHLSKHKSLPTAGKLYHCDICDKPYHCDICDKSFSQRHSLAAHICIHTGKKPFDSDIHGKLFNETSHLSKHKSLQTAEKLYHCDICGRSFSQSGNLTTHKHIHTGDKPYPCEICGKSFSQSDFPFSGKYVVSLPVVFKSFTFNKFCMSSDTNTESFRIFAQQISDDIGIVESFKDERKVLYTRDINLFV